jgi:hypothetical protein
VLFQERGGDHRPALRADVLAEEHRPGVEAVADGLRDQAAAAVREGAADLHQLARAVRVEPNDGEEALVAELEVPRDPRRGLPLGRHPDDLAAALLHAAQPGAEGGVLGLEVERFLVPAGLGPGVDLGNGILERHRACGVGITLIVHAAEVLAAARHEDADQAVGAEPPVGVDGHALRVGPVAVQPDAGQRGDVLGAGDPAAEDRRPVRFLQGEGGLEPLAGRHHARLSGVREQTAEANAGGRDAQGAGGTRRFRPDLTTCKALPSR